MDLSNLTTLFIPQTEETIVKCPSIVMDAGFQAGVMVILSAYLLVYVMRHEDVKQFLRYRWGFLVALMTFITCSMILWGSIWFGSMLGGD